MVPKGIDSHLFECYGQIVLPYPSPSSKWGHVAELAKDSGNGGEEGYDMWERGNSLRIHHYSFSVSKFLVSQARISCFEAENVTWTHYSTLCNSVVTLLLYTYKNSATVAAILMQTLLVVWKVPNILRKDHLAQLFTWANVKTNLAVLLLNINCKVDEWFPIFLITFIHSLYLEHEICRGSVLIAVERCIVVCNFESLNHLCTRMRRKIKAKGAKSCGTWICFSLLGPHYLIKPSFHWLYESSFLCYINHAVVMASINFE